MKVRELIEMLKTMPQDSDVKYVYDGGVRSNVDLCYLSNSNSVVCVGYGDYVSNDEDLPKDMPAGSTFDSNHMFWFNQENGYSECEF